jgi:hypothetical protein
MKKYFTIFILTIFFACSPRQQGDNTVNNTSLTSTDSISQNTRPAKGNTINVKSNNFNGYQTSTYDSPEFAAQLTRHKESLKQLSDKSVFSIIHNKLISTLPENHKEYFKTKLDYELLSIAKGDLFQNNRDDYTFLVYDKKNLRLSILVYNELTKKHFELFRDIKIENGLESADCNYRAFGTLDYQLADEIIYQKEYLIKKPESYLESTPCKIVDLSKDGDFVLKSGCFSKKVSKTNLSNSLCIATSSVYNNWECLKYDKSKDIFFIFYGQAFAD